MAKLDLNVPGGAKGRGGGSVLGVVTFIGVLVTLGAVVWVGVSRGGEVRSVGNVGVDGSSVDGEVGDAGRLKALAEGLERQTLYSQAADVWGEYVGVGGVEGEGLGDIRYRQGKCLKQAGRYGEAARCFLEAEGLPLGDERKRSAGQLYLECLSALGKHAVREAEVRKRATGGADDGDIVLATVGGEEITASDLRAELERQAAEAARMQGLNSEQAKQMVSQFLSNRDQVSQMVQMQVTHRVLYEEALERGLGESAETSAAVDRMRRDYLAQAVMEDRVSGIALSDTDVENHYKAHQEKFTEPAAVRVRYAVFPSKEAAEAAIGAGTLDRSEGHAVDQWVTREGGVPGVGGSGAMMAHLFALEAGSWGDKAWPVEAGAGANVWVVFRVDEKRDSRVPALDEIRDRVAADLRAVKEDEAIAALQDELRAKFSVEINSAGLAKMMGSAAADGS